MSEYKPSYMQDEDEEQTSTANPIQAPQNTLNAQAAPGSSTGQSAPAPSAAPTSTSAEGGNLGVSSGTSAAPAAPNASKRSSGQFTNLQKFIGANKGADLGGRIQGNIQKQTEQAKETLTKKAGEVGDVLAKQKQERTAVFGDRSTLGEGQTGGTAGQALTQVGGIKEVSANEVAPTSQTAQDLTQQEQALTQARDYRYKGPENFDISDVENQKAVAESQAKATGSSSGRFGLLQEMFGRTGYGAGQQKLDNLLLQSDKDAQNKLAQARISTRQFGREVEDTKQKTGQEIKTEQAAAKTEIDTFAKNLGTTSEALNTNLEQRVAAINPALAEDFASFTDEEKAGILSKIGFKKNANGEFEIADLTSVGINELNDIFNQVKTDASITNLDKDQLARANLLQKIRGQSELGQFDEAGQPFGVRKEVGEAYKDIAQYAPQEGAALASPQMINENTNRIATNASKIPAAKLDNLIYDTKDQIAGLTGQMSDPDAIKKTAQFQLLTPKEQSEILKLASGLKPQRVSADGRELFDNDTYNAQRSVAKRLSDLAQNRAQEAKSYVTEQNRAQKTAIDNMAKYLRETQGREARDVFAKDWTPTTYDNKTAYSQGGGLAPQRAKRYE